MVRLRSSAQSASPWHTSCERRANNMQTDKACFHNVHATDVDHGVMDVPRTYYIQCTLCTHAQICATITTTLSGNAPGYDVERQPSFSLMHGPSNTVGGEEAVHGERLDCVPQTSTHLRAFLAFCVGSKILLLRPSAMSLSTLQLQFQRSARSYSRRATFQRRIFVSQTEAPLHVIIPARFELVCPDTPRCTVLNSVPWALADIVPYKEDGHSKSRYLRYGMAIDYEHSQATVQYGRSHGHAFCEPYFGC
ncbi:hypothetical protein J1614_008325 [Plenodomus biglobosus]|nr:hypothetical protein J1614_008325 [Plenodomus biglobosus]